MDRDSSTDIACLYTVDKKKVLYPEIHKNYDDNDYSYVEGVLMLQEKKSHSLHTLFYRARQNFSSGIEQNFIIVGDKDKKRKTAGSISQVRLCLVSVIFNPQFACTRGLQ